MNAQVLDVVAREKPVPFDIPSADDFTLQEAGIVDAQEILDNPNISLYCLEPENKQAVFVETPESAEIVTAPFYYISQFELADRVYKISYETLRQLAEEVQIDDRRMVLIYSMGRCGTTLASAAFNQGVDVVSLSEPDVFTQLVKIRNSTQPSDEGISALTKDCLLMTCKDGASDHQPVWVIKFRSFVVEIADLIYSQFPHAKCLFFYRNADTWGKSVARAFGGIDTPTDEEVVGFWMWTKDVIRKLGSYKLDNLEDINAGLLISLMWINYMERCSEYLEKGQPILPVRYEDIKENPEPVFTKIFDYCGVNIANEDDLLGVLQEDSQAKSQISREQLEQITWGLDPEDFADIERMISEHPTINRMDYRLPGTLELEQ